jgi:integrase/recombinase XerD
MQKNQVKVHDLCDQLEQVMWEYGYSNDCMGRYEGIFRELHDFVGEENYSQKICSDFLTEKLQITGGFVEKGEHSRNQMLYLRAMRTLADYHNFGTLFHRKEINELILWPETFRGPMENYVSHLIVRRLSQRYIRKTELLVRDLILYLDTAGIHCFEDIRAEHVSGFISSQIGYAPSTVGGKISILRRLFQYLYLNECISYPLAEGLPKVLTFARTTLPTVWSSEDIEKILKAVDRGNPCGKRDYAMILLIARLGLRIGDVRDLKLSDINWNTNEIRIIQNKTKEPLTLPLMEDVGWAIIDYLKNGRPVTSYPNVFVRHMAPFMPFSSNYNLHGMITKIISKAGIAAEKRAHTGMHSLRHSLASELMKNNVEINVISDILGHCDPETTRHYLRVDLPALRQCALSMEV